MTIGVNDYAAASRCPGACNSQCSAAPCAGAFACCQCDSFALQRVCRDLGVNVSNFGIGDARTWPGACAAHGVRVDHTPGVHSVVCMPNVSSAGHVGFVLEVGPSAHAGAGQVFVEDYNWGFSCGYRQHTLAVQASGSYETVFIHFKDGGAPPPQCPPCPPCQTCVDPARGCQPIQCPPGTSCIGNRCLPPQPPPGAVSEAVPIVLAIGIVATGVFLWRKPGARAWIRDEERHWVKRLGGEHSSFGAASSGRHRERDGRQRDALSQLRANAGRAPMLRAASFLLPDGAFLGWGTGRHAVDGHKELLWTSGDDSLWPDSEPLDAMLSCGWVRVTAYGDYVGLELERPLTPAQMQAVRDGTRDALTVHVDVGALGDDSLLGSRGATPATTSAVAGLLRWANTLAATQRKVDVHGFERDNAYRAVEA